MDAQGVESAGDRPAEAAAGRPLRSGCGPSSTVFGLRIATAVERCAAGEAGASRRRDRFGRRAIIAAVAGGTGGLVGCAGRLPRAVGGSGTPLRVFAPSLDPVRHPLLQAWQRTGPRPAFGLELLRGMNVVLSGGLLRREHLAVGKADVVESPYAGLVDLDPYLRGVNFDSASLLAQAVLPFRSSCGALTALPLRLGEIQFYVNGPLLRRLRIRPPRRWTYAAMVAALEVRRTSARLRDWPAIVGLGWGDLRLWGALVLGLGGGFTRGGRVDLVAAVGATAAVAAMARRFGWRPVTSADPALRDFELRGFQGSGVLGALFAFLPPGVPSGGETPQAFPLLPRRAVVPAWEPTGLSVLRHERNPADAVRFMVWLYRPPQQRLLMTAGIPPVVADFGLRAFWQALPPSAPRFRFHGYTDTAAWVRQVWGAAGSLVSESPAALQRIGAGVDVAWALQRWQQSVQAAVAQRSPTAPVCHGPIPPAGEGQTTLTLRVGPSPVAVGRHAGVGASVQG